jgi:5-methylthioadenosine/S-adenosylhomocysteine deaminase
MKADIVLIKNDHSPVMLPILNTYGHVAFQAQRADVQTVVVNGKLVKHDHKLIGDALTKARTAVEQTVEHLESTLGPDEWEAGKHPDIPESKVLDNPYMYTDYVGE